MGEWPQVWRVPSGHQPQRTAAGGCREGQRWPAPESDQLVTSGLCHYGGHGGLCLGNYLVRGKEVGLQGVCPSCLSISLLPSAHCIPPASQAGNPGTPPLFPAGQMMGWFPNVPGLLLQVKNKAKEGGIRDCESRTEAWDSGTQKRPGANY